MNLSGSITAFLPIAFASAGSAGSFALLRNWIGEKLIRPHKTTIREKLKPYVPQVLAYLTVALAWAAVASALIHINENDSMNWYRTTMVLALFTSLVLLIDPHEFGFHGIYPVIGYAVLSSGRLIRMSHRRRTIARLISAVKTTSRFPRSLSGLCTLCVVPPIM